MSGNESHTVDGGEAEHGDARQNCQLGEPLKKKQHQDLQSARGKEGEFIEFVKELFESRLTLPNGVELQIQRSHRALIPKPAASSTPRSIIVNFLQFHVKELILRKAWQQKIEMNGKQLYFDNDYVTDIMERRKAYGPIKEALKKRWIWYQTPYTKMRVHWDSRMRIYGTADKAAQDLIRRGLEVMVTKKVSAATAAEERLNAVMPWKCTIASESTAQRSRQRLTEAPSERTEMNKVMIVARVNPNIKIFYIIFYLLELIFTF